MKPINRDRIRLFWAAWIAIFVVAMLPNLFLPPTWWAGLLRLLVGICVAPAAMWTGYYFLVGPRAARRWWLLFRFVLANWSRVDVMIVARRTRGKESVDANV